MRSCHPTFLCAWLSDTFLAFPPHTAPPIASGVMDTPPTMR